MLRKDIHPGLEVAVRDQWKSIERGEVTELLPSNRYRIELKSGRSRGHHLELSSRSILSPWSEYEPYYQTRRRQELRSEAERIMADQAQADKMERLQIIREHLVLHGIHAGLGNVHVPGEGYDPALFIRFDHCLTLDQVLSRVASAELLGSPETPETNDS